MIPVALSRAGGVQLHAARVLGITEQSPWHRIKKDAIQERVAGHTAGQLADAPAPGSLRPAPLSPSN
jgi:hypothetical protein